MSLCLPFSALLMYKDWLLSPGWVGAQVALMPFTRFVSCRAFSAEYLRARNFFCAAFVFCACVLILASFAPAQTPTLLYNFGAHTGDPLYPFWEGIIAQGRDGNLYSTT